MKKWAVVFIAMSCFAQAVLAFEVVPVAPSGFNAGGEVYLSDDTGVQGPLVVDKWDAEYVSIDPWSELTLDSWYSNALGSADGSFSAFEHAPGIIMVDLHLGASASVSTSSTVADVHGSATIETITSPTSHGYFFSIDPNMPGEQIGDQVTVTMDLNIYNNLSGNAYANVRGSRDMDHIAVTLNETPPVWPGDPLDIREIWTLPNLMNLTENDMHNYNHTFTAHLGDVIGVFLAADVYAGVTTSGSANIGCYPSIYFTVELTTNPMDFNNDGYVDLLDMAEFMEEWLWVRPGR